MNPCARSAGYVTVMTIFKWWKIVIQVDILCKCFCMDTKQGK